jgi:uncharacterized protein YndB with AHSA1/START domain
MLDYTIRLEHLVPAAQPLRWQALTESALLSQWLMANDFEPRAGHRFTFRAEPTVVWDGVVRCEVTEVRPIERLAYSWTGAADMPKTMVTWELAPAGAQTRLTLVHSGFHGIKYALIGRFLKRGWQDMIGRRLPLALRSHSEGLAGCRAVLAR